MAQPFDQGAACRSLLAVGHGRGFVVEVGRRLGASTHVARERLVITAAHCLKHLPPAGPPDTRNLTFRNLLGPLGSKRRSITAECLFVDPVSDLAVFGAPDSQELSEEHTAYEHLMAAHAPLPLAPFDSFGRSRGWLASLEGGWFECEVLQNGGGIWVFGARKGILGGMSGSPILNAGGKAIGVISSSGSVAGATSTDGGPQPRLTHHLPAGLLQQILKGQGRGKGHKAQAALASTGTKTRTNPSQRKRG